MLQQGRIGEVYNIGGRSECENIELVRLLCGIVDDELQADEERSARYPNAASQRWAQRGV